MRADRPRTGPRRSAWEWTSRTRSAKRRGQVAQTARPEETRDRTRSLKSLSWKKVRMNTAIVPKELAPRELQGKRSEKSTKPPTSHTQNGVTCV